MHQEDIERIEHFQNWCRELKILLLQNNLLPRIENLNKLKKLEYLNLAVNNIETIENLEQLESLEKLDLTLNFIADLTSAETLRSNYRLRDLVLTGNPCCDYAGYRNFVIHTLPQLKSLDGVEIKATERILAGKDFGKCRAEIERQQIEQFARREAQKQRVMKQIEKDAQENVGLSEEEINER